MSKEEQKTAAVPGKQTSHIHFPPAAPLPVGNDPIWPQRSGYESATPPNVLGLTPDIHQIDLSTARVKVPLNVAGTVIWLMFMETIATGLVSTDVLRIGYNFDVQHPCPFRDGNFIVGAPFNRLYLSNVAVAGVTAHLAIFNVQPNQQLDLR